MNHLIEEFKKLNTPKRVDFIAEMVYSSDEEVTKKKKFVNQNQITNFFKKKCSHVFHAIVAILP